MDNVKFEFFIGNTYSRDFSISKLEYKIDKLYFSVKENNKNKKCVIQKTINQGITLLEEDENTTTYNLLINPEDTEHLKTNVEYSFDIKIVSNVHDKEIKRTIVTGTLLLKDCTTKEYNEVR